jgi:hypothetical protein
VASLLDEEAVELRIHERSLLWRFLGKGRHRVCFRHHRVHPTDAGARRRGGANSEGSQNRLVAPLAGSRRPGKVAGTAR